MLMKAFLAGLSLVFLFSLSLARTADASANYLTVDLACTQGGGVDAQVSWIGASTTATQQWMDISLTNNGWAQGTFAGIGPVAAGKTSIVASALIPNAIYFVRINQQLPGNYWDSSPTFDFRTPPDCSRVLAKPTLIVTTTTTPNTDNSSSNAGGATTTPSTSGASDNCDPDYYGACLNPNSADYDCVGKGDGPDFIKGPVYLTGKADPFELDNDGDGIGCNEP